MSSRRSRCPGHSSKPQTTIRSKGFNSPYFAEHAAEALEFLNIPEAAELARQAASLRESIEGRHVEARKAGTIEAFMATYEGAPFQAVDDAYVSRAREWREARILFIRQNVDAFVDE